MRADKQKKVKSGGSTLKRLKTTLRSAGVIGSIKKRNAKPADRAEKLKKITDRVNPFELKVTRQKHDVLGRKIKGAVGKPGVTRQVGHENRKKTLLGELKRKNKTGAFNDKRFGENDANMTVEDKMLERFAREKQKRAEKGLVFNLESDEEELTHFGQSLSQMDDIAEHDPRLEDDQDQDGIRRDQVNQLHFGGFGDEAAERDGKKKPYAEIVKEIIAKSKYHKQERQRQKEENEDLRRELNDDFDDIRNVLFAASTQAAAEQQQQQRAVTKSDPDAADEKDYDVVVRSLVYEKKAKPLDRLKTEEEVIREEAERLQALERRRLRRMQGLASDSEQSDNEDGGRGVGGDDLDVNYVLDENAFDDEEREMMKRRNNTDDALVYKNGALVNADRIMVRPRSTKPKKGSADLSDEESEDEDGWTDDGESDEGSELASKGGDEESVSEEGSESAESDQESDVQSMPEVIENNDNAPFTEFAAEDDECDDQSIASESEDAPEIAEELPFTFPAPQSYADLEKLFANRTLEEQVTIVKRLRVLYHISLGAGNRQSLQKLLVFILQHFEHAARAAEPDHIADADASPMDRMDIVITAFLPEVFALAAQFPETMDQYATKQVQTYQAALKRRLPNAPRPFVRLHELMTCQVFCRVFATSDYFHAIITPLYLMMGEWMSGLAQRIAVRSSSQRLSTGLVRDVVSALLLCHIYIESQQESKRYMPEVLLVLNTLLSVMTCTTVEHGTFPKFTDSTDGSCLRTSAYDQDVETPLLNPFEALALESLPSNHDELLKQLLKATVSTTVSVATMWAAHELTITASEAPKQSSADALEDEIDVTAVFVAPTATAGTWAWTEVFSDTIALLSPIPDAHTALLSLRSQILAVREKQAQKLGLPRRARMQWQKKRVQSIRLATPKFEDNYNPDRHYDPDPVRSEQRKLKAQYKSELKGAVRELKKDAAFLRTEKVRELKSRDKEYSTRMKRVYGMLANDNGNANAERKKARKHK